MKISTFPKAETFRTGTVEIEVRFKEGDKVLHTITVAIDDPDGSMGSIELKEAALQKAPEVLSQLQEFMKTALSELG